MAGRLFRKIAQSICDSSLRRAFAQRIVAASAAFFHLELVAQPRSLPHTDVHPTISFYRSYP